MKAYTAKEPSLTRPQGKVKNSFYSLLRLFTRSILESYSFHTIAIAGTCSLIH